MMFDYYPDRLEEKESLEDKRETLRNESVYLALNFAFLTNE
jgi:hypothetical protein